jgi:hypothetical protein
VPQERIAARVRRARIRRAAEAGLLAVAVAAGVVSGVTLAHDHAPGHATSYSGLSLPASFTASDGAAYRRLAVTSLTEPARPAAALVVTAGSSPIDVMGACDRPESAVFVIVNVEGANPGMITCRDSPQLLGLSLRPGQRTRITFDVVSPLGSPKVSWRFAAYAWKPPVTVRPAPAEPRLPPSYSGPSTTGGYGNALRRLVASRSGDWPGDRAVTVTVPAGTGTLDVSVVCAGAIAGRLQMSISSPALQGEETPCQSWAPGQPLSAQTFIGARDGKPLTLTFRIQAPSPDTAAAYAKRAASWTIAVYEEQT